MKPSKHGITAFDVVARIAFSGGRAAAPETTLKAEGAPARRTRAARGLAGFVQRLEAAGAL